MDMQGSYVMLLNGETCGNFLEEGTGYDFFDIFLKK